VSVDPEIRRRVAASGYETPGFAERYDDVRPRPPEALRSLVPPLVAGGLTSVVDLGSGTGLSTRFWASAADEVIGVEPSAAMRALAADRTPVPNVRYVAGSGAATGLPTASADLVTASQSLHWMDPEPTFREIARILRPAGVLCAYEYRSLTTPNWDAEAAYRELRERAARIRLERGIDRGLPQWPLSLESITAGGWFDDVRETFLHSVEFGDGARLVALALSEGSLTTLLAAGVSEEEVGLSTLRQAAREMANQPWWIGYRVWLARRGSAPAPA
jgi:SAM-dependent methyltransferase